MQATEVLKIILEMDGVLSGKLFILDSQNFTTQIISFKKNLDIPKVNKLSDYEDICIAEDFQVNEISPSELRDMLVKNPELPLIDLRDENDRTDIGFNCISIPYYEISKKLHMIIRREPIVFYCKYGVQSRHVINYLRKVHKIENLYNLVI
jgi:rhodanese-related sulfurtransferase